MTHKTTLMKLTSRLLAQRDAVRKTLNGDLDILTEVSATSSVGDDVDAAVHSSNHEVCSRLIEMESQELHQIEHALERINAEVYGRCEFCGGQISSARLNALPYTDSCINCQRENERRGRSERRIPTRRAGVESMRIRSTRTTRHRSNLVTWRRFLLAVDTDF